MVLNVPWNHLRTCDFWFTYSLSQRDLVAPWSRGLKRRPSAYMLRVTLKNWTWQAIRTWAQIFTSRKRFVLNVIGVSDYKCNFNALIDSNFQNLWTPFSIVWTKINCICVCVGVIIIHNLQKVPPVSRFRVQTECRGAGILQAVWLCSQLHHGHHHKSQEEAGWYLLSSVDLF